MDPSIINDTSCYCPVVRGIHWSTVDSHYKGKIMRTFDVSLLSAWKNFLTNTRLAGNLRCHKSVPWHLYEIVLDISLTYEDLNKIIFAEDLSKCMSFIGTSRFFVCFGSCFFAFVLCFRWYKYDMIFNLCLDVLATFNVQWYLLGMSN